MLPCYRIYHGIPNRYLEGTIDFDDCSNVALTSRDEIAWHLQRFSLPYNGKVNLKKTNLFPNQLVAEIACHLQRFSLLYNGKVNPKDKTFPQSVGFLHVLLQFCFMRARSFRKRVVSLVNVHNSWYCFKHLSDIITTKGEIFPYYLESSLPRHEMCICFSEK